MRLFDMASKIIIIEDNGQITTEYHEKGKGGWSKADENLNILAIRRLFHKAIRDHMKKKIK